MTTADKANSRFLRIIARSDEYAPDLGERDSASPHPSVEDLRAFVHEALPESQMEKIEESIVNSDKLFQAYLGLRIEEAAYDQTGAPDHIRRGARRAFLDAAPPMPPIQPSLAERLRSRFDSLFGRHQFVPIAGAVATIAIFTFLFLAQDRGPQAVEIAELYVASESKGENQIIIRGGGENNNDSASNPDTYSIPSQPDLEKVATSKKLILATQDLSDLLTSGLSDTGTLKKKALVDAINAGIADGSEKLSPMQFSVVVLSEQLAFELKQRVDLSRTELNILLLDSAVPEASTEASPPQDILFISKN